jgi:hypothetical protein
MIFRGLKIMSVDKIDSVLHFVLLNRGGDYVDCYAAKYALVKALENAKNIIIKLEGNLTNLTAKNSLINADNIRLLEENGSLQLELTCV